MFYRIIRYIKNLYSGRYGMDALNMCLIILSCTLTFILSFFNNRYIGIIGAIPLIIAMLRIFSVNFEKRRAENLKFIQFMQPWKVWFYKMLGKSRKKAEQRQDTEHRYFDCPNCKRTLRVPAHKGKIEIHCPHCGTSFKKNTGRKNT